MKTFLLIFFIGCLHGLALAQSVKITLGYQTITDEYFDEKKTVLDDSTSLFNIIYHFDSLSERYNGEINHYYRRYRYDFDSTYIFREDRSVEKLNISFSQKDIDRIVKILGKEYKISDRKVKMLNSPFAIELKLAVGGKEYQLRREISSCDYEFYWYVNNSYFFNPELDKFIWKLLPENLKIDCPLIKKTIRKQKEFHGEELKVKANDIYSLYLKGDQNKLKLAIKELLPTEQTYKYMFEKNVESNISGEFYRKVMVGNGMPDLIEQLQNTFMNDLNRTFGRNEVEHLTLDSINIEVGYQDFLMKQRNVPERSGCYEVAIVTYYFEDVYSEFPIEVLLSHFIRFNDMWYAISYPR
ncbi:hypothetical protein RCC89_18580 [Cytophagaceae bacterium ABcell3]|nr:hypothetical protein RCC89_18580 [Cytophagaceae bacterium ABcell3]